MSAHRLLRIAVIAVVLPALFHLSQRVAAASGNEPVAGIEWAIGAVGALFFLRALATEYSQGPEANFHKDLQWGVAAGCVVIVLSRF
jgi:hypothetical protein